VTAVADLALPRHDGDASKGDRGTVLVVAGGAETPGAALLAGVAALRVGAGKLQLATDRLVLASLAIAVPEALVVAFDDVALLVPEADAVLIGPGLRPGPATDALVDVVLDGAKGAVVVDAGALGALGQRGELRMPAVATPNADELHLLADDVVAAARRLGCVVTCRDARTTVASPDGRTWIVDDGCVGLATSGSGDVAAGVIAGLCARGASPEAAAVWGARVHGRAGVLLAERIGPLGFLARELLDVIPQALPS
jgi:ADP-dependent NAD(P)H-hydrate dehydratase